MLIRLLIFIILGVVVVRAVKSWTGAGLQRKETTGGGPPVQVDDDMIKDPVCGAYFPERDAVTLEENGRRLKFCSTRCRDRYIEARDELA